MELSQQYGTVTYTRNNGWADIRSISKRPSLRTCNQDDGAHLDIKDSGFWGGWSQFSFRIFNPRALLNDIILTASMNERNMEHTKSAFVRLNTQVLSSSCFFHLWRHGCLHYGTTQAQCRIWAQEKLLIEGAWHPFRPRVFTLLKTVWMLTSEVSATPLQLPIILARAECDIALGRHCMREEYNSQDDSVTILSLYNMASST